MTDISGTNSPDQIDGSLYSDDVVIYGWDASNPLGDEGPRTDADTLLDGTGNDLIYAGAGADVLYAQGFGRDVLFGSTGADMVIAEFGLSSLSLGNFLAGGRGEDTLTVYGGNGGMIVTIAPGQQGHMGSDGLFVIGFEVLRARGGAGADQFNGGALADSLRGEAGDDSLQGGDGADTLKGGAGNDLMQGGAGDDQFILTYNEDLKTSVDVIEGGDGIDVLSLDRTTQKGNYTLTLQEDPGVHHLPGRATYSGIERLDFSGGAGDDIVTGGALADSLIDGQGGANVFTGVGGNDTLWASDSGSRMYGGTGDDEVTLQTDLSGTAVAEGGDGVDVLGLSLSNVTDGLVLSVADLQGSYALTGGISLSGFERILFRGGEGSDTVTGGQLDDTLYGNDGNDILLDFSGQTDLFGGAGNDDLTASGRLFGNAGHDVMMGLAGDDVLIGGFGRDTMTGGAGADSFVFGHLSAHGQADLIGDFTPGEDVMTLRASGFTGLDLGPLADNQLATPSTVTDETRMIYISVSGFLLFDADGAGGAEAVLLAILPRALDLSGADFNVI